jgi:hypothetical protein
MQIAYILIFADRSNGIERNHHKITMILELKILLAQKKKIIVFSMIRTGIIYFTRDLIIA